jgi:hypothetical protein
MPLNAKQTVKIMLLRRRSGFPAHQYADSVLHEQAFAASFAEIRWVAGAAKDADAVTCDKLMPQRGFTHRTIVGRWPDLPIQPFSNRARVWKGAALIE